MWKQDLGLKSHQTEHYRIRKSLMQWLFAKIQPNTYKMHRWLKNATKIEPGNMVSCEETIGLKSNHINPGNETNTHQLANASVDFIWQVSNQRYSPCMVSKNFKGKKKIFLAMFAIFHPLLARNPPRWA